MDTKVRLWTCQVSDDISGQETEILLVCTTRSKTLGYTDNNR